ncbi:MAG: hypothetical protein ACRD5W_03620, partial [Candidatus Acidiferrales bacterium]
MKSRNVHAIFAAAIVLAAAGCGGSQPPAEKTEAPKATAPAVDPAMAATINGSVKLDGTAARARRINMAAEPSCAAKHSGSPAMTEEVVTGSGGTLANVVVYVKEGV